MQLVNRLVRLYINIKPAFFFRILPVKSVIMNYENV